MKNTDYAAWMSFPIPESEVANRNWELEYKHLAKQNADMLVALKAIEIMGRNANSRNDRAIHMGDTARRAIAKAEGDND